MHLLELGYLKGGNAAAHFVDSGIFYLLFLRVPKLTLTFISSSS